ncbi:MAG: pitrilysin family protein [Bacteroidota bacterium]|nr:pitrilysin family protein [Bacteroidota bacterium]
MKKYLLLLVLFLIVLSGYSQSSLPSNFFLKTLSNGLQVLVIEDHSVPLATIEIAVKNGSFSESPEFNGLSHLYEHMFFKANKDYPSQEAFMDRIKELGISFNGTTSTEKVNYFSTLPKFNLTKGIEFMNSAIRYPKFDTTEMRKENVVVDGEFQRNESNPFFALSDAMNHHMWGDLYSRKNAIGNHQIILSATPAKMETIKNKYYWPNNSLLTVAGDVKHEDVFKQVANIMGSWKPSGFDPFKKYPIPEFQPLQKSSYFIVQSDNARVPVIMIDWMGPDTRNDLPNTYAADVFSYILSQNSSRLSKSLLESGLALQVRFNYTTQKYVGPITLLVVPNPSKVKECFEEVKKQINLMEADDYFTDEQLATAKRKLEIEDVRGREITSDYVHIVSFWWCSASLDYYFNYINHVQKVTRADIQQYVRKYIKGKPYCAGLLVSHDMDQQLQPEMFFKSN